MNTDAPDVNNLPEWLTPAEVATIFRVDPKTVTRWAKAGKIDHIVTFGGHRRYSRDAIKAKIKESM